MPSFKHTLICIGSMCDDDCNLKKQAIVVYDPQKLPIIAGWREPTGEKIWRTSLRLVPTNTPTLPTEDKRASLQAFSAYDLPSVGALVRYLHAASGFPVQHLALSY